MILVLNVECSLHRSQGYVREGVEIDNSLHGRINESHHSEERPDLMSPVWMLIRFSGMIVHRIEVGVEWINCDAGFGWIWI